MGISNGLRTAVEPFKALSNHKKALGDPSGAFMYPSKALSFPILFFTLLIICSLWQYTNCQVTFSRDWNAGKRSIEGISNDCSALYRSVATICNAVFKNIQSNRLHGGSEDLESPTVFGGRI